MTPSSPRGEAQPREGSRLNQIRIGRRLTLCFALIILVMLAGSGTLDPRNYSGVGFMDFVPTKLIDTNSMETASDDWFVDFNNDGKPQMSIGRLPVNTSEEATSVVNKIIAYEQSGSTQGVVLVSMRRQASAANYKAQADMLQAQLAYLLAGAELDQAVGRTPGL